MQPDTLGTTLRQLNLISGPCSAVMAENVMHNFLQANNVRDKKKLEELFVRTRKDALQVLCASLLQERKMDVKGPYGSFKKTGLNLEQIRRLRIQDRSIYVLPKDIRRLTHLTSISLSGCNLMFIPDELTGLPRLRTVDLSRNKIFSIPTSVRRMQRLRVLDLSHNCLTHLPAQLGQLTKLRKLCINFNEIEILPQWMSEMEGLRTLDCRDNPLRSISIHFDKLTSLTNLSLSKEGGLDVLHLARLSKIKATIHLDDLTIPYKKGDSLFELLVRKAKFYDPTLRCQLSREVLHGFVGFDFRRNNSERSLLEGYLRKAYFWIKMDSAENYNCTLRIFLTTLERLYKSSDQKGQHDGLLVAATAICIAIFHDIDTAKKCIETIPAEGRHHRFKLLATMVYHDLLANRLRSVWIQFRLNRELARCGLRQDWYEKQEKKIRREVVKIFPFLRTI